MDVSENGGFSPQIIHFLIGFSIINNPCWGTPIFVDVGMFGYLVIQAVTFLGWLSNQVARTQGVYVRDLQGSGMKFGHGLNHLVNKHFIAFSHVKIVIQAD